MPDSDLFLLYDLAIPALSLILLGIALLVGGSNHRRPSMFVALILMVLVAVRILEVLVSNADMDVYWDMVMSFGFVSARYLPDVGPPWGIAGWLAYLWTPFTYGLLHADGFHL